MRLLRRIEKKGPLTYSDSRHNLPPIAMGGPRGVERRVVPANKPGATYQLARF